MTQPEPSAAYRQARAALREAELDLVDRTEQVAEQRRSLPSGPVLDDYVLQELVGGLDANGHKEIALSSLVPADGEPLLVYHLMFGKRQVDPCPMCTMWVDGFNGVARHVAQHGELVVLAAADEKALRAHARSRGWDRIRLLSAGDTSIKRDLGSEDDEGNQCSLLTVLRREEDGRVHLTYATSPELSETRRERGIDALCATWSLLDLTPGGRGDWYASLDDGGRA